MKKQKRKHFVCNHTEQKHCKNTKRKQKSATADGRVTPPVVFAVFSFVYLMHTCQYRQ